MKCKWHHKPPDKITSVCSVPRSQSDADRSANNGVDDEGTQTQSQCPAAANGVALGGSKAALDAPLWGLRYHASFPLSENACEAIQITYRFARVMVMTLMQLQLL